MTVGERIRAARENQDLSQEDLAKKLGLKDKSSVCKIEKSGDNISTKSIKKYASVLSIKPSELMGWDFVAENHYSEDDSELIKEDLRAYYEELEKTSMKMIESEQEQLGSAGFALKIALTRMTKQELQNLYDVAKIMIPHAFEDKEA